MALSNPIKNKFSAQNTAQQMAIAVGFELVLLKMAKVAANNLGELDVEGAGKFGVKLEERFLADSAKPHRFYRASAGSTVERQVYLQLLWATAATDSSGQNIFDVVQSGRLPDKVAGVYSGQIPMTIGTTITNVSVTFALEFTGAVTELPSTFGSSRPDIRLSLGQGTDGKYYEAIYDLTSEAQKDHVLNKGDNWLTKTYVPYIAEIIWTNDDILLK